MSVDERLWQRVREDLKTAPDALRGQLSNKTCWPWKVWHDPE